MKKMMSINNKFLVNLSKNNNFYVSEEVVEHINFKIEEYDRLTKKREHLNPTKDLDELIKINLEIKKVEVTEEELELLKRVDERKKKCKSDNIHYWIIPNYQEPYESPHCHWCSMKVTDYSKKIR